MVGLFVGIGMAVFGLNGPWLFQRFGLNVPEAAAVGVLAGVAVGAGVAHLLVRRAEQPQLIEPKNIVGRTARNSGSPETEATRLQIEHALTGLIPDDGAKIGVEVRGRRVILQGTVHSWQEEAEAERIAFDTPGIERVENRLEVVK